MSSAYSDVILVTRVKLRILRREFTHSVRTTFEGKLAVAIMVAAPFLMKRTLVSSTLRQASMNEDSGWVVLWTAHLFMMTALVLFVAAQTARSLIVDRRDEALAHYPHARQGLAAFHLWGGVVATRALMLFAFFYLFYGSLVSRLAVQPAGFRSGWRRSERPSCPTRRSTLPATRCVTESRALPPPSRRPSR